MVSRASVSAGAGSLRYQYKQNYSNLPFAGPVQAFKIKSLARPPRSAGEPSHAAPLDPEELLLLLLRGWRGSRLCQKARNHGGLSRCQQADYTHFSHLRCCTSGDYRTRKCVMRWNGQSTFPVPRGRLCLSRSIFTLQRVESSLA